jgi:hypothetical protein
VRASTTFSTKHFGIRIAEPRTRERDLQAAEVINGAQEDLIGVALGANSVRSASGAHDFRATRLGRGKPTGNACPQPRLREEYWRALHPLRARVKGVNRPAHRSR